MKKLKPTELKQIDFKLLFELMKNSNRNDRQLAKVLGVSQPTVTRRRAMLEENYIEGYTVFPKFFEIGFEIMALTFFRSNFRGEQGQYDEESLKRLKDWCNDQSHIVVAVNGIGLGWNSGFFSYHQNYTSLTEFLRTFETELSDLVSESQTFIINLRTDAVFKPFNLRQLAINKKVN